MAVVLIVALCCVFPSSAAAGPSSDEDSSFNIRGYLATKFVGRTASNADNSYDDQDMYEYLRMDLEAPEGGGYEAHFFAFARQDIDGQSDRHDFSPLEDQGNARDTGRTGYVYDAHMAFNRPLGHISQVRLGRQAGMRDEMALFDGLALDMDLGKYLAASLYGGAAVHFEELDNSHGEDTLGGAGLDIRLHRSSLVSLDYFHASDKRDFFGYVDEDNELASIRIWQRISRSINVSARYRALDGDDRDVRFRALGSFPGAGFEVMGGYYRQLNEQEQLASELSSYYDVIGNTAEYESHTLKVRKYFGGRYALDLGYFSRGLMDDKPDTRFNREYERLYAGLGVEDVIMAGLDLSVTFEQWDAGRNSYSSGGFDASYQYKRLGRRASMSAGTYYSLYKYDHYMELGARENVRTVYARTSMPLPADLTANVKYEYESGSENYHTASLGVRYDF